MNGRILRQSRILLIFILLANIPLFSGLQAERANAAMKRAPGMQAHFSPVLTDEKAFLEKINRYRQQNHLSILKADWDLFRLARLEANHLAAGKIRTLSDHKLNTLLSGMGRSKIHVHSLTIPVLSDKQFADPASWPATDIHQFVADRSVSLLGTGYGRGEKGAFWVLLTAEKIK